MFSISNVMLLLFGLLSFSIFLSSHIVIFFIFLILNFPPKLSQMWGFERTNKGSDILNAYTNYLKRLLAPIIIKTIGLGREKRSR